MGNVLGQGAFGTTYMAHWRGAQVRYTGAALPLMLQNADS